MADINVTGPDGSTFSFPEGTDNATISSVLNQHYGTQPSGSDQRVKAENWSDVPLAALKNAPASAVEFGKNLVEPFLHPVQTAENLGALGKGLYSKAQGAIGVEQNPAQKAQDEKAANAVGEFFTKRYGGLDNLKKTMSEDPIGFLGDAATILTGGELALGRVPGVVGQTAKIAGKVGSAIDPVTNAAKVVGAGAKYIAEPLASNALALSTGLSADTIRTAGRAGYEGNIAFTDAMRGNTGLGDILENAKGALSDARDARAAAYRTGMAGVKADTTALDFAPIDQALINARDKAYYRGAAYSDDAVKTLTQIEDKIAEWKQQGPQVIVGPNGQAQMVDVFRTPEGFDALKKSLGDIRQKTTQGSQERLIADTVYNAVKDAITQQAPEYAKTMKGYQSASKKIEEATRTFSLGEKATEDTAIRKLLSATRDNVNTNFGQRAKILDEMAQYRPELPYQISGAAMNSLLPRGLARLLPGAEGLAGYATGTLLNPKLLAAVAASSPRLVGEGLYAGGRAMSMLPRVPTVAPLLAQQGGQINGLLSQ